jgi:transcriptional regulator with XRE-family HTH domain
MLPMHYERVKKLREKQCLSQAIEKLARMTDVSNSTIFNIEAGNQDNPPSTH